MINLPDIHPVNMESDWKNYVCLFSWLIVPTWQCWQKARTLKQTSKRLHELFLALLFMILTMLTFSREIGENACINHSYLSCFQKLFVLLTQLFAQRTVRLAQRSTWQEFNGLLTTCIMYKNTIFFIQKNSLSTTLNYFYYFKNWKTAL